MRRRRRHVHRSPLGRERRFVEKALAGLDAAHAKGAIEMPADLDPAMHAAVRRAASFALLLNARQLERAMSRIWRATTEHFGVVLVEEMAPAMKHRVADDAEVREGFESRLAERWRRPLFALAALHSLSLEAGVLFHRQHAPAEGDWVYVAIVNLHAHAVRVTGEVLALLRAGYASGAHARWRNLHEAAVTASFISQHGQATAERFLRHDVVEQHRAAVEFQEASDRLTDEPLEPDFLEALAAERDGLVGRFGAAYGTPYGWAALALDSKRPTFRDIEQDVHMDHMRPYYRMASHSIHPGPRAISFDIGDPVGELMLAGPTNTGLADPGHSSAMSLWQVTATLLSLRLDAGQVTLIRMLESLQKVIGDLFLEVQQDVERAIAEDAALDANDLGRR